MPTNKPVSQLGTLPDKVLAELRAETRAAFDAARRIPVQAAREAWHYLVGFDADNPGAWPVYSGASRAAIVIGLNDDLPEVPGSVLQITQGPSEERYERHANQDYVEHPNIDMIEDVANEYELDDDIVIGISDEHVPYLRKINEKYGRLIENEAAFLAQSVIDREVATFNARSIAAQKGSRTRRRRS